MTSSCRSASGTGKTPNRTSTAPDTSSGDNAVNCRRMFESLHRRPRGRRAALLLDLVKGRSSRDEAWAAVMPPAPGDFPFERRTLPPTDPPGPVTTGLTSQLDDDQLALLR